MAITNPQTKLRELVLDTLNSEFETDDISFRDDKLHASLGADGPIGGVYPAEDYENVGDQLVITVTCYVQLFLQWDERIDPTQEVSPQPIEEAAERIRRALQAVEPSGTPEADNHLWDFHVSRVTYPYDPTGNITRLEATVVGRAQNPALVSTTG